jgi:hypothetical protein
MLVWHPPRLPGRGLVPHLILHGMCACARAVRVVKCKKRRKGGREGERENSLAMESWMVQLAPPHTLVEVVVWWWGWCLLVAICVCPALDHVAEDVRAPLCNLLLFLEVDSGSAAEIQMVHLLASHCSEVSLTPPEPRPGLSPTATRHRWRAHAKRRGECVATQARPCPHCAEFHPCARGGGGGGSNQPTNQPTNHQTIDVILPTLLQHPSTIHPPQLRCSSPTTHCIFLIVPPH